MLAPLEDRDTPAAAAWLAGPANRASHLAGAAPSGRLLFDILAPARQEGQ